MAHPLDGALAHIDRADRDFDELKAILEKLIKSEEDKARADYDLRRLKGVGIFDVSGVEIRGFGIPQVLSDAAVIVSAIIHHCRAALDYLVFELAFNDSKVIQHGTQFIIEDFKADPNDRSRGFDARAKSKLRGVSGTHIDAIEELQLYRGVQWTTILRDISNSDKHRKLDLIGGSQTIGHRILVGELGSFEGHPGTIIRSLTSGKALQMQINSSAYIGFPEWDNIPVLQTLETIKTKVRATLDSFRAEFK